MKKYSKQDKKLLVIWAANCAERVLPFFENYSKDNQPRKAIEIIKNWVKTDMPKISIIRKISLDIHSAARIVKENNAACFAARSCGQAVATAHVTQHSFGASWYALKAIAETNSVNTETKVKEEYNWQLNQLPEHLRKIFLNTVIITKINNKITIKIKKGENF